MSTTSLIRAIRHPLGIDPGKRELAEQNSLEEHVREMLYQVLLTDPGERLNRPDFGCGIRRLLFSPLNESAAGLAQATILKALEDTLSSVIVVDRVEVEFRDETADIKVVYNQKTSGALHTLDVEVPS